MIAMSRMARGRHFTDQVYLGRGGALFEGQLLPGPTLAGKHPQSVEPNARSGRFIPVGSGTFWDPLIPTGVSQDHYSAANNNDNHNRTHYEIGDPAPERHHEQAGDDDAGVRDHVIL